MCYDEVMANTKHGHTWPGGHSRTYTSWQSMKVRCRPGGKYEARGITVHAPWAKFSNFLADMGERPDGTTLDRIDNDGNYEPGNCRWATPKEQAANRRQTRKCLEDCTCGRHRTPEFTEEHRRRISEAKKGRVMTEETRRKISETKRAAKRSSRCEEGCACRRHRSAEWRRSA